MAKKYPEEFLARLNAVTGKRPRTVIDHILKHGHITTEELKDVYGYSHPPRAARDVREQGIPLEVFSMTAKDGRKMAAYRFGDPAKVRGGSHAGRSNFPKAFKKQLLERDGNKCAVCSGKFDASFLQIDHRIPYEVGGQAPGHPNPDHYMLLCRECNRGKSWACEHCPNWLKDKKSEVCRTCFWGNPIEYSHIATQQLRRLDVVWTGNKEAKEFDTLAGYARDVNTDLPEFVKSILRKHL